MIWLTYNVNALLRALDANSLQTLLKLLEINNSSLDVSNFLENVDEERSFYDFFFDVLIEKNIPCAMNIDWRWEPSDIFWQLEKQLPGQRIQLVKSEDNPDYQAFDVTYKLNNATKDITINFDDPDALLESVEQQLTGTRFIGINFGDDSYSWLTAPAGFDTEEFCKLTGLEVTNKSNVSLKNREPALSLNFAGDYKQPEKFFFLPSILYVKNDNDIYLFRYKSLGSEEIINQVWAGRVLAGQTIREGIAVELRSELGYGGRFEYSYGGFESRLKDKRGHDINRYRLTIFLYDGSFSKKTSGGYEVALQKVEGLQLNNFSRI